MTCDEGWDEMRRAEMRWHEVRRNQMIRDEMRWSVECDHEVCSVKCGLWKVQCEVWSVKCEENVRLALHCDVIAHRSCSWTTTQQQARTHAWTTTPGGRTAHASSIDEKGLIDKSNTTSAPPRAGTTGSLPNTAEICPCRISWDFVSWLSKSSFDNGSPLFYVHKKITTW